MQNSRSQPPTPAGCGPSMKEAAVGTSAVVAVCGGCGGDAGGGKAFAAARLEQQQVVEKQKDYGPALCVLGLIDAALGNKDAALQQGRRAMELLPAEEDAVDGQALKAYFALIAAWAGEKDLALQQLAYAASTPGAGLITSY